MSRSAKGLIESLLIRAKAPLPWSVAEQRDRNGAYHAVLDAGGADLNHREYEPGDARRMAALGALAPRAMAYVEASASRGGSAAQEILADYIAISEGRA